MAEFRWRLYYDDGSTFSDADGEPCESPVWGCVGLSQPGVASKADRALIGNGDFYIYRTDLGLWHEVGDSGLIDHLAHFAHLISCVRPGRWMPERDEFRHIWDRIRKDSADD